MPNLNNSEPNMSCSITDGEQPNDREITEEEILAGEEIAAEKYRDAFYSGDDLGYNVDLICELSDERQNVLTNLFEGDDNDGAWTLEIHDIADEIRQIRKQKTDEYAADNNWFTGGHREG